MSFTSYKELTVWQKSMDLTEEIYRLVKKLPKEETYALSDQMRRAAVSVPSNIAEGHGRQTEKEFKSFLSIARGSCYEIETQLLICVRQKYLSDPETKPVFDLLSEISRMLTALILRLSSNSNEPSKTKN